MKGLAVIASLGLLLASGGALAQSDAPKTTSPQAAPPAAAPNPAAPDPAAPQTFTLQPQGGAAGIVLISGKTVIVEVHADKTVKVLKVESITPDRVRRFRPGRDMVSTAAEGQVAITLLFDPRIGSLLKVENSGDFSFDYSAIVSGMNKEGDAYKAPADVCPSVKGAAFYEIWDHAISSVYLTGFGRHDTPPPCPGPKKAKPSSGPTSDA